MMKKLYKTLLLFIFISAIGAFIYVDTYAAKSKANTLAALRDDLKSLEAQKAKNDNAKKQTNSQINNSKQNIYSAQNEISDNRTKIEEAIIKVEESKKEIENQREDMNEVIIAYQLSTGNNEYLDYIFDADNITDLIYRYSVSEQLLEWQKEEIKKFEQLVKENEQLQVDLSKRETQLETQISNLEKKVANLGNQLAEITEISVDIADDIKSAKEYIKFIENAGCGENQDIDSCLRMVTDTGFRVPLKKGRISSGFGYRKHPTTGALQSFHNAIDIAVAEGTKVYASAAGTVGKIINRASCGGNSVYVWHYVNGKKYTTQYTHLLKINVKIGDIVTSESVVGLVGGGSTAKKRGGYDTCTTGAHLHFAMANGHYGGSGSNSYSAYSTYLINCFDPKAFLKLPSSW